MKAMRGWALLGASLAAFGLSACGGDDDNGGGNGGSDAGPADAKNDPRVDTSTGTPDGRTDVAADNRDSGTGGDTDGGSKAEGGTDTGGGGEGGDGGSLVQRGEYLVKNVGACGDCHTPRNLVTGQPIPGMFLAGMNGIFQVPGLGPDGGNGIVGTPNLTPDMATGLGSWTDDQIKKAFLDGIDKDGKALISIMPYFVLHNMSANDADAIVAYLRTIPAVNNTIAERNFDLPGASPPVPASAIPDPTLATTDPNYASAMRGKYLAGNFGVCMECHTEHVQTPGAVPIDVTKLFAGGERFVSAAIGVPSPPYPAVIYTENVTPHSTGIAGWTAAAVANVLKNGVDKDGVAICPPMPNGPNGAFGGITDADALDIGNYIIHLPPISNTIPAICHDVMRQDGGPDGAAPEGGSDGAAPDAAPDTTSTPDATNDGTVDSAGSDGAGDGSSGDGSSGDGSDGSSGDGSDGSTGDATSDGADGQG